MSEIVHTGPVSPRVRAVIDTFEVDTAARKRRGGALVRRILATAGSAPDQTCRVHPHDWNDIIRHFGLHVVYTNHLYGRPPDESGVLLESSPRRICVTWDLNVSEADVA